MIWWSRGAGQVTAVWHNMREEVCIYINGRPYVLREEERPFKNMQARAPRAAPLPGKKHRALPHGLTWSPLAHRYLAGRRQVPAQLPWSIAEEGGAQRCTFEQHWQCTRERAQLAACRLVRV